jgi:subtilase family serine protease
VEVAIGNIGTLPAGSFYVKLEVYWINGSLVEDSQETLISGLGAEQTTTVNFTSLFHPTHTGQYQLTATVDSRGNISENNETNNELILNNVSVTVMGDIKGDGNVNILDAVKISLAYGATPTSPYWNLKADLNHDGHIDILDATRIGLHWGEKS